MTDLITEFRTSYFPRIAVSVDMIATGTDIKPLEVVLFIRAVKSRSFFEQMKGRGARIINDDDLRAVSPDAETKEHFVIVDAVGVCEQDKTDSRPMDRKKSVSFEKLLQALSLGSTDPDVISSIASRLARLNRKLKPKDHSRVSQCMGGKNLNTLISDLVSALDPERHLESAKAQSRVAVPQAADQMIQEAVKPLYDPELRALLVELKKKDEQTIDHVSQDEVIAAEFDAQALEKAKGIVGSFKDFIRENRCRFPN